MSCICLHSEGQATFSSATHGEMHVHGLPKWLQGLEVLQPNNTKVSHLRTCRIRRTHLSWFAKYKATSPADLMPPGSLSLAPVPTSVPMLDLEGDSDIEVIARRIPHAELPLDEALPERTPTPPASPA